MNKTDKFFRDGEWCEEAYQKHIAEEAQMEWEKSNAPWQTAIRRWLNDGASYPTIMLRADGRGCSLAIYCRGRAFEVQHGISPCLICPYGTQNMSLIQELSRVFEEYRKNLLENSGNE